MSSVYYFEKCPKCGAEVTEEMTGYPELAGYEDNTCQCSRCKTKFVIMVDLHKISEKTKKLK